MKQKILLIKTWILTHKKTSIAIGLIVIIAGYYGYKSITNTSGETRYITATAQTGTVIASVTGTGQVSASDQIDIKSKVSGNIISLPVKAGDVLHAGDVIARIDSHDAQIALQTAQLSFAKLTEPVDALSLLQAQNALTTAQEDLSKSYEDGFNEVASTFFDFPSIVTGLNDLFYGQASFLNYDTVKNVDDAAAQYQITAAAHYDATKASYDVTFTTYKGIDRTSPKSQIESLINTVYETARSLAETTKDAKDTVDYIQGVQSSYNKSSAAVTLTNLNTWTSTINGHLSTLLATKTAIQSDKRTIQEKTNSIAKLQSGPDPIDMQTSQLAVQQKQDALVDYTIRALFDGVVAKVDVTGHDSVSSGTLIGTLVTKEKIAQVSLNEVDAAKVKIGQKVTLTFDAINGLSIAGLVSEVDLVGTVTQGVVNYTTKISFDTQDDRVKPGMSTSAAIITDLKQDVLTVPNSAVKSDAQGSYVEVFTTPLGAAPAGTQGTPSTTLPTQLSVTTGLSSDTTTEIVSGITEGQQVVTRTIASTTTASAPSAASLLSGSRSGGGGTGRPAALPGR